MVGQVPGQHARVAVGALGDLAEQRVAPERAAEPARQAQLDRRVVHRGALREQVGRIDTDVARVAGQRPALVDGLDDVALLELREIGVGLRGVRRRIRLEDATVALEDAAAKRARAPPGPDVRGRGLCVLLDVGRTADAADVEEHPVHEARRLDIVALGVREDGGRRVRHDAPVLRGDSLGGRIELAAWIVAGGVQQRQDRARGVPRVDGRPQKVRSHVRRPVERIERRQRARRREHGPEGAVGGRFVAAPERVAQLDREEVRRRAREGAQASELLGHARVVSRGVQRVEARQRVARGGPRRIAHGRDELRAGARRRGVLGVGEQRGPRERAACPIERGPCAIEQVIASRDDGLERIEDGRARARALLRALRLEVAQDLDVHLLSPAADAREHGVGDGALPARRPRLEDAFVGAAFSLGARGDGEVPRRVDGATVDERELRRCAGPVRGAPQHLLGLARIAGRHGAGRREEHLVASPGRRRLDGRDAEDPAGRRRAHGGSVRAQRRAVLAEGIDLDGVVVLGRAHAGDDAQRSRSRGERAKRAASPSPSSKGRRRTTVPPARRIAAPCGAQHEADALAVRDVDVDDDLADPGSRALGGQLEIAPVVAYDDRVGSGPERVAARVGRLEAGVRAIERSRLPRRP